MPFRACVGEQIKVVVGHSCASGGCCRARPSSQACKISMFDGSSASIAHSLASIGIKAKVVVPGSLYDICLDPNQHPGMCVGDGWFPDFPSPGNGLIDLFGGPSLSSSDISHMGPTPSELAREHDPVRSVPSVDPQIEA